MLTRNPGTSGTVTDVSQPVSVNHQAKKLHWGRTILVGSGTMAIDDVVPGVVAGSADGQKVPGFGIILSLMSRPLPSLSVSLLLLCCRNASPSPRPSEPPLAAIFLEQCRQRSLDFEDQYHGQEMVCKHR